MLEMFKNDFKYLKVACEDTSNGEKVACEDTGNGDGRALPFVSHKRINGD